MADYLVSKLRDGQTGLPAASQVGWISSGFASLGILAENLDSARDFPPGVFIDAIPDVWGKALVFAYALADGNHPFHGSAVGAFRGFLGMLALRERLGHNISVVPVPLNGNIAARFTSVAAELLPSGSAAPSLTWDPTHILMLNDEVVGITSPLTIIAPKEGTDLKQATAQGLSDGFRFIDPTNTLDATTAADLAAWIAQLAANLVSMGAGQTKRWHEAVTTALKDFREDLTARADGETRRADLSPHTLELGGAYGTLIGTPLVATYGVSDVELARPENCDNDRLLVIDKKTPDAWSLDPARVRIWGSLTHANISNQELGSNPTRIGSTTLNGIQWTKPEDLLLPQLTVVNDPNGFRDVKRVYGVDQLGLNSAIAPLLPVSERLTRYLHPDYIAARSRFAMVGNEIEFTVDLPVGDRGRTIQARRRYPLSNLTRIDRAELPVCEIWPGIATEGWDSWYAFCSNAGVVGRYIMRPMGPRIKKTEERTAEGAPDVVVSTSSSAPALLALTELQTRPGAASQEVFRGIIIPEYKGRDRGGIQGDAIVGFDFGTTNTEIYIQIGTNPPEPLTVSIPTLSITGVAEDTRLGAMYRFFLPPGTPIESGPFLSLLRRRRGTNENHQPVAIEDAHVLFHRSRNSKDQLDDPFVHAYLKWSAEHHGDRKAFLSQFALMSARHALASGARRLRFRYSYPTAFNETQKLWVKGVWPQIIEELKSAIPRDCEIALDEPKTESVAAAQYFSTITYAPPALLEVGTVVIDIGGGTSDISVWQRGKVCLQTSVRWSAREILLRAFEKNRKDSLSLLFDHLHCPPDFKPPLESKTGDNFYRYADALLRSSGDNLFGDLVNATGRPDYKKLCSYVTFALGGLLYYAGIVLRAAGFTTVPRIYVAGNGSRVLHWLNPKKYERSAPYHKLFRDAIYSGAGIGITKDSVLDLIVSEEPKCEAARGLVMGKLAAFDNPEECNAIIAGEQFTEDGASQDVVSRLTPEGCSKRGIDVIELIELKIWRDIFNAFASNVGSVVYPIANLEEGLKRTTDEVRQECLSWHNKNPNSLFIRPLFIAGLEAFMKNVEWSSASDAAGV